MIKSNPVNAILSAEIVPHAEEQTNLVLAELDRVINENPTFALEFKQRGGSIILRADDELLLEDVLTLLVQRHRVECREIQIVFRETIRKKAEAEGKYIRQTGGSGNYGHCWLRIEPNEPGKGYEFVNEIKGGVVPKEYINPIDQGIQAAMELGILAGFHMVDVKVALTDGSYHEADSNEMAFKFAASIAFKEAAKRASPVLLEPVMAVEVKVPEEFTGVIVGDINSRRGRIEGMEHAAGSQLVKAMVPLKELLRSSRHGRPSWSIRFARYQPIPRSDEIDDDGLPVFSPNPRDPRPRNHASSVRPGEH